MRTAALALVAAVALAGAPGARAADAPPQIDENDIHVERSGDSFTIDFVAHAPVPIARAWAVLTDFESMPSFVPNLSSSQVLERNGNTFKVAQKGTAHFGIFSKDFESVREVQLFPMREIRTHGIGGNVEHIDSVMRLDADGGGTRLTYHTQAQAGFWLPPLIGTATVRSHTAEQFNALIQQMLKMP